MGTIVRTTIRRILTAAFIAFSFATMLAGCITSGGSVFTADASPEAALRTRVQLARSYIGEQNWEDAKRNLAIARDIDPDNPEVAEAFALVYQSTGEYELAEEDFKRAIAGKKEFSRARNNYAAFLYSQARYQEAEDQLEVVIKDTLYESRPQAFINLGLCRVRLDKPDEAREAFVRALTMDRGNRIALLELANIEYEAGNWRLAERYMDNFKGISRSMPPRALWLGVRIYHELDDQDAQASFGLALRNLYPTSAEFQAYEQAVQNGEL